MIRRIFLTSLFVGSVFLSVGCSKGGLSASDLQFVKASVGLMKLKSTMPPNADSNYIKPRLDSAFKSYGMTPDSYEAYTQELVKDPDHTQLVYAAIKDSMGLR